MAVASQLITGYEVEMLATTLGSSVCVGVLVERRHCVPYDTMSAYPGELKNEH
jgi:hypothetical protein